MGCFIEQRNQSTLSMAVELRHALIWLSWSPPCPPYQGVRSGWTCMKASAIPHGESWRALGQERACVSEKKAGVRALAHTHQRTNLSLETFMWGLER